jgi:hypothetical protein
MVYIVSHADNDISEKNSSSIFREEVYKVKKHKNNIVALTIAVFSHTYISLLR